MARTSFDAAYYARFYRDPARRVGDRSGTERLAAFVAAYLAHLEIAPRTVLDLGCGLGWWREPIERALPGARWRGVEQSEHLCAELGWERGSVVDYRGRAADLVICQGVLQYLSDRDARRALGTLARLSKKALYLEAVTREDWQDVLDRKRSDREIEIRPLAFYREGLIRRGLVPCGGGLFVKRGAATLFALERG